MKKVGGRFDETSDKYGMNSPAWNWWETFEYWFTKILVKINILISKVDLNVNYVCRTILNFAVYFTLCYFVNNEQYQSNNIFLIFAKCLSKTFVVLLVRISQWFVTMMKITETMRKMMSSEASATKNKLKKCSTLTSVMYDIPNILYD